MDDLFAWTDSYGDEHYLNLAHVARVTLHPRTSPPSATVTLAAGLGGRVPTETLRGEAAVRLREELRRRAGAAPAGEQPAEASAGAVPRGPGGRNGRGGRAR